MSKNRLVRGMLLALMLLAFPRTGRAGLGEVILEMSGPQLYGFLADCRLPIQGPTVETCRALGAKLYGRAENLKVWLSIAGGVYFSTSSKGYGHGEVKMLSFDPILEVRGINQRRFRTYHGVMGVSYNYFAGENFENFSSAALKLRPLGISILLRKTPDETLQFDVDYNVRIYPNAFDPQDFGRPAAAPNNKPEAVHAFGIGLRYQFGD